MSLEITDIPEDFRIHDDSNTNKKRYILGACLAVVAIVVFACFFNASTTEEANIPAVDLGLPDEGSLSSCSKNCMTQRSACYKAGFAIPKETRGDAVKKCNPAYNTCYAGCKL